MPPPLSEHSPAVLAEERASAPEAPVASNAWVVDLLLLASLWGASFLFAKVAVAEFGALPTASLRVGLSAIALVAWVLLRNQAGQMWRHIKVTAPIGIINGAFPFAAYCYALLYVNSGLTAVLNASAPMFGALVAWLWLREKLSMSRVAGLGIGFAGVVLLAASTVGLEAHHDRWHTLLAILAALSAALSYGISANVVKRYASDVPPMALASGGMVGASVLLVPIGLWYWPSTAPSLKAWMAAAALALLCTGLAYVIFYRLIARAGPQRALTVTFLLPVLALLYGNVLLDEPVTLIMLLAAAIIVCGVALATGVAQSLRARWSPAPPQA